MVLSEQGAKEEGVFSEAAKLVPGTETPPLPLPPQQKAQRRRIMQYKRKVYAPLKQKYLNLPEKYTPLPWNFAGEQLRDLRRYFFLSQGQAVTKLNELLKSTKDKLEPEKDEPEPEIALSTWQNWEKDRTRPHMKTYILITKLFSGEKERSDREFDHFALEFMQVFSRGNPSWYKHLGYRP